jgi:hypothetical protein
MGKNIQPTQVTQDMAKSLFDKFKDAVGNSVKVRGRSIVG